MVLGLVATSCARGASQRWVHVSVTMGNRSSEYSVKAAPLLTRSAAAHSRPAFVFLTLPRSGRLSSFCSAAQRSDHRTAGGTGRKVTSSVGIGDLRPFRNGLHEVIMEPWRPPCRTLGERASPRRAPPRGSGSRRGSPRRTRAQIGRAHV